MPRWLLIAGTGTIGLAIASLLAVYAYGRFAASVRGPASQALARLPDATPLDRRIGALTTGHEDETGLVLLGSNLDAFAARMVSARSAGRSLDLMYYIWNEDLTGRLLLGEVLAAADRGVRVRLLLDDIGVGGEDATLLALDAHPGIELRLFNPTRVRDNPLRRGVEMLLRAVSVTRRMHNKAWIADGRVLIAGGRNIGDEYFDADGSSNFRDMDLIGFGPVVQQADAMFDAYWNGEAALPVSALGSVAPDTLPALRRRLAALAEQAGSEPYIAALREHVALFEPRPGRLHWSRQVRLVADPPEKAAGGKGGNWLTRELFPLLTAARERVEISSPYFVPGEVGTAELRKLATRGVSVSILTNSLAASDVAAVHGGYAPYRKALLEGGVRLFELRPSADRTPFSLRGSGNASLHTKAFSVDGRVGFIGSLNFDPRSSSLNTEMGILFQVPALIAEMRAVFAEEITPDLSYALGIDDGGALRWYGEQDGRPATWRRDPEASLLRRLTARVVGWLPLESQL